MIGAAVDPASPVPLHAQIKAIVRAMLDQPPYRDGTVLPDEVSLADQLKVGRGTVRQAIGALVNEGVVERRRGIGTRRIPATIAGDMASFHSFSREMAHAGVAVRLIGATLKSRSAPGSVAGALGIEIGLRISHLVRVRGDDRGPIALFTSWFAPGIDLRAEDDLASPLYDLIRARGGPQPATSEEELLAIRPSSEVARFLGVGTEAPILERRRRVLAADGRCFEYAVVHYRSDRFHLRLNLGAGGE